MNYGQHPGWIEVICGVMFSGKSEELIRRVRRAIIARIRDLEGEIRTIQDDSALRASFEAALEGRDGGKRA